MTRSDLVRFAVKRMTRQLESGSLILFFFFVIVKMTSFQFEVILILETLSAYPSSSWSLTLHRRSTGQPLLPSFRRGVILPPPSTLPIPVSFLPSACNLALGLSQPHLLRCSSPMPNLSFLPLVVALCCHYLVRLTLNSSATLSRIASKST